jgi:hypothetical protein
VIATGRPAEVLTPARIAAVFEVGAEVDPDADGRCRLRLHRLARSGEAPAAQAGGGGSVTASF